MAQDPLAMVYGGQIGQGQAQVFDTSGIAKQVILQNKEKDKAFLDSIIDLDVSKVWNQDLPEYNEMWGKYRTFVADNYKALSNPSRNVDKWSEKKRMEQELLNYVATSNSQKKEYAEFGKSLRTVNNDGNKKWNTTKDENEFLADGKTTNPNYGRDLYELWKHASLEDRSSMNIWDLRTAVQKDIAPKLDALYTKLSRPGGAGSVLTAIETQTPDGKGGKIVDIKQTVDVTAWDNNIVEYYRNNPNTASQINGLYEKRKEEAGGELFMPITYWDDDKGVEVTEDVLIENGEQYMIASSRTRIPKGSEKQRYTKPAQFKTIVNIADKKEARWDISGKSDTYTSSSSGYVKANDGVGVTVYPMRYSLSNVPFMSTGSEFKGKITSNFGGDFSGATMPPNAKFDGFFKDDNGKIGFSVSMKSSVISDQVAEKTKTRNSKQSKLDKIETDKPESIINGKVVANPQIAKLQKELDVLNTEISDLSKVKNQDQRLMIPLEDENGAPINLSILDVNGLPSTIEEIEAVVGGRSGKKAEFENIDNI